MSVVDPFTIRPARVEEIVDLRHAVLRPGRAREAAEFDVDRLPGTRHFIALFGSKVVGCATIAPTKWDGLDAWQLRGMAVAAEARKTGLGRAMLEAIERSFDRPEHPVFLWCNARVEAIGFYKTCGWAVQSDVFEVPDVGPHVKMTRSIPLKSTSASAR
jgi:predicted GNAT family N-acyltransferase